MGGLRSTFLDAQYIQKSKLQLGRNILTEVDTRLL